MQLRVDRKFILAAFLAMLLVILYLPLTAVETKATPKKLIEYGWAAPTPDFFRQNIKAMEQHPFDGVMVKLNAGKEVFKKTAYPNAAFAQDRQDLAATQSNRLTDNFVVMWSGMDAQWDWFDDADWLAAETNIRNFAKTAKLGRFRGIAFDSEPYTTNPWKYDKQPKQQTKTFAAYQKQVRKRGAQFMQALQSEQPGTQVLAFGLLSWMKDLWLAKIEPSKLPPELVNNNYGLWPAFINGMLDVTEPSSVLIDGHEWSYYFTRTNEFDRTHDSIFKDARIFVARINDEKYTNNVKIGQAIYPDLLLDLFPRGTKDPRSGKTMPHFLSPSDRLQLLEHNIYHALRTTDRYAWMYGETADWWQNKIPRQIEVSAAIRRAKTKIDKGQPLGFDIAPTIKEALKECRAVNKECW